MFLLFYRNFKGIYGKIEQSNAFKDYYSTIKKTQNEPAAPAQVAPTPNDSFEKNNSEAQKNKKGPIAAIAFLGTVVTLGVLAKKGKLGNGAQKFIDKIFKPKNAKNILETASTKTSEVAGTIVKNTGDITQEAARDTIKITEKIVEAAEDTAAVAKKLMLSQKLRLWKKLQISLLRFQMMLR